jgi:hypothetical protein
VTENLECSTFPLALKRCKTWLTSMQMNNKLIIIIRFLVSKFR